MKTKYLNILTLFLCLSVVFSSSCLPSQVRLLIGEKYSNSSSPYTARIMYQTQGECTTSGVVLQNKSLASVKDSSVHSLWDNLFCHNGKKNCENVKYDQYIHSVQIAAVPAQSFSYSVCADISNQSECTQQYTSVMPTLTKSPSKQLKVLFYGDHDLSAAGQITFQALSNTLKKETFDLFLFLGDYAYEFYQDNGKLGDDYVSALTSVNTAAPMAITAGNHEDNFNFEFFNQKFVMPNFENTKNNYYSINVGNVHFISLNLHYYNSGSVKNPPNSFTQNEMLTWTENDLKAVDREKTPWVIVFGHKPIYCKGSDCDTFADDFSEFDFLLNEYNVDLFISGHKHKFQVMKPIINSRIGPYSISKDNVISNYVGFPTIIQGNGGTWKQDDGIQLKQSLPKNSDYPFTTKQQKNSMLYENENIGFGKLTIKDDRNLLIESYDSYSEEVIYTLGLNKPDYLKQSNDEQ